MATLRLKDVSKTIGENKIVQNVNLDVVNGEFLVLVGPSGCGKTTILRIIAGLEQVSGGEVYIDEKLVNNRAPKDRDIAMVFQSYALYPHMTVKENLSFGLKMRGYANVDIEKQIAESAQMLGLEKLMGRYPKQLSGGQRQRVAMGRAMVRDPKVFLFDEPLSNLDAALRSQMRVELRKLHKKLKPTMVYVTHDQVEAMTLADRIAVIDRGVIQHIGTPEQLYFHPANLFVAGFIGSPAMNFVKGEIVMQGLEPKVRVNNSFLSFQVDRLWNVAQEGQKVTVGIRPHDLKLANGTKLNILKMGTEVMEPLGWEVLVHGKLGKVPFVAQLSNEASKKIKMDEMINLVVEPQALHLFNVETGMSLLK